ncbi:hypothetical protein QGX15_gp003 [Pseudomonas phage psageK4e]|uniref:Uncharacterized protein n=1 Tax=Pseudomonas phage psageK4e TaxID=2875723 RepID=A0AAE8XMY6_9CAUD|nr:hypothetical protein QGX15_gp003 [Pseudomonas phage psageK4e]UAW53451.1 hypothetical protein psageK4e_003 [Pseudomonas phage psageK4e]
MSENASYYFHFTGGQPSGCGAWLNTSRSNLGSGKGVTL